MMRPKIAARILSDVSLAAPTPVAAPKVQEGSLAGQLRAFLHIATPPPTAPAAPTKDQVQANFDVLSRSVNRELGEARSHLWFVIGAAAFSVVMALVAHFVSNLSGVITTIVAGGGSTSGIAVTTRDSLGSYSSLKTLRRIQLDEIGTHLEKATTPAQLAAVQKEIDDVLAAITKSLTQTNAQPSPVGAIPHS